MNKIGQIIYRLRDWRSNEYFSTSKTDHSVIKHSEEAIDIFANMVTQYGGIKHIIKLGIQAPAGTVFEINNSQIIIGHNCLYEIPYDDLNITKLLVVQPNSSEALTDIIIDFKYEEETLYGN